MNLVADDRLQELVSGPSGITRARREFLVELLRDISVDRFLFIRETMPLDECAFVGLCLGEVPFCSSTQKLAAHS